MSKQTGSFVFLIILAAAGAMAAYALNQSFPEDDSAPLAVAQPAPQVQNGQTPAIAQPEEEPLPPIDTSNWKTYTSRNYPFTFKYPATWTATVLATSEPFDTIRLTTADKNMLIHIYLSRQNYLGLEGLETKPITVGGQAGVSVQGALVGVPYKNVFYTFDLGNATKYRAEFQALVESVVFK